MQSPQAKIPGSDVLMSRSATMYPSLPSFTTPCMNSVFGTRPMKTKTPSAGTSRVCAASFTPASFTCVTASVPPIAVTTGVTTAVRYYSVDVAGNVEATKTITVSPGVDTFAPTTTVSIPPPDGDNGWHRTPPVTVTLTAEDVWLGVDETYYQVGGGSTWTTYVTPITVTTQGTTTVVFYSIDVVGNEEAVQTATVRLDSVPPSTEFEVVTATATVVLTGTDGTSGVASTHYQVDAGGWQTYTEPIEVATGVTTTVDYYSVDVAGNVEATQTRTVCPDHSAPEYRTFLPLVLR